MEPPWRKVRVVVALVVRGATALMVTVAQEQATGLGMVAALAAAEPQVVPHR